MGLFLAGNELAESFMIRGVYKLPFQFLGSDIWITTTAISSWIITLMILIFGIVAGNKFANAKELIIRANEIVSPLPYNYKNAMKSGWVD